MSGESAGDPRGPRSDRPVSWASIDNDDSRDLDQLTVAEALPGDAVKIRVAVADVDALVKDGSAIDEHARHNTTSVYTAAKIFPMLPEKLSTDLTSLNLDEERLAVVVEMVIGADGSVQGSDIYRARVRNRAKLAYNSVAAWLEGTAPSQGDCGRQWTGGEPARAGPDRPEPEELRHVHGALSLETIEARPIFDGDHIRGLEVEQKNRAKELIEDFMIAANGVTARYLAAKNFPSIRRVVRTPKRWDRIVELAQEHKFRLPDNPDSVALDAVSRQGESRRSAALPRPVPGGDQTPGSGRIRGRTARRRPRGTSVLAVKDYAHSTAPNRRYPDLITQRLLKAAIAGRAAPYSYAELDVLAKHFTEEEDAANKVERQVGKSAAALLLESRIGEQFDAIVTGASDKGTWARLLTIPVEGRVVRGFEGADVGDQIRVQLIAVDVERGFIDFGTPESAPDLMTRS